MLYNTVQAFMYYYNIDNKNHGPYTLAELHHFYHQGLINAQTAVWCESFGSQWERLAVLFAEMQAQGMNVELGAETGALSSEIQQKMSVFGVIALAFKGMKANFGKILLFGLLPFAVSYALSMLLSIVMQVVLVMSFSFSSPPTIPGGSGTPASTAGGVGNAVLDLLLEPRTLLIVALYMLVYLVTTIVSHLSLLGSMRVMLTHIGGSYTKVSDCFAVFKKPWPYLVNSISSLPLIIFNVLVMFACFWLAMHLDDYSLFSNPEKMSQERFFSIFAVNMTGALICMLVTTPAFICNLFLTAQSNEVCPREIFRQTISLSFDNYFGWLGIMIFCGIINILAALFFMLPMVISYPFSIFVMALYFCYCQMRRKALHKAAAGQNPQTRQLQS